MTSDTFRARRWLRAVTPSWDEVSSVDGLTLTLHDGTAVRVNRQAASDAQKVLTPLVATGDLTRDRVEWAHGVEGPWAPEGVARFLLDCATACGASDIHLEPGANEAQIRFRVLGELTPFVALELRVAERLVAAFKALSGCLPYRKDLVQEGRVARPGVTADVRTSFIPTALGERAALRLFGRLLDLDALGFSAGLREQFDAVLTHEAGLVIVSGPSGAGKTTTLYAALARVAARRLGAHLSLEDPVEQRLRVAGVPVDQVELCPERGLTQEAALVAALRQDIDVLAVGEVRTAAEANLAVKAAHTGRLVLAGLHAGSVDEARQRMKDLGVEAKLLDQTLVAVLHQRLRTSPCEAHSVHCACQGLLKRRVVEAQLWVARLAMRGVA